MSRLFWDAGGRKAPGERRNVKLIELLNHGAENAVSLDFLSAMSGLSKRRVRDELSNITITGDEVVCTDAEGKGYYLAATIEEAERYRKYNRSYYLSGILKDRGIGRFIERKQNEQQISLFKE